MNELLFSPEALSDLQEIKRYITQELGSPDAAENTLRKIMKNIRLLEAQPMIGAPLSSIISISTHYRFLVCGNYLAFYYVETKKGLHSTCNLQQTGLYQNFVR